MNEKNHFSRIMIELSDKELEDYLNNKSDYQEEAILAAELELNKRKGIAPPVNSDKNKEVKVNENQPAETEIGISKNNPDVDPPIENIHKIQSFPSKPVEEIKQKSLKQSLISLGVFILVFYSIFRWDFIYILVLAGIVLIHELGHYLAMRAFRYKDLGIFFVPLVGAFASGTKERVSQKQEIIILLAGPLPGVLLGLLFYYFGISEQNEFMTRTANIFMLLNLFNLLPIMPLDGGRVIKSLFFENNETINKIFIFISIAVMSFIALRTESYFLLIIPIALLLQLRSGALTKKIRNEITSRGGELNKTYQELLDEEYWKIREILGKESPYFKTLITPGSYVISYREDRIIKEVKSIIQKKPERDLKVLGKTLVIFIWILSFIAPAVFIAFLYIKNGIV